MAHSLTTIGVHLECAIHAKMVVEVSSNQKEAISSISAQIHFMQESCERVRKCAKVKGRVELKVDKTQSKRPSVTISPNYIIPTPTVSGLTSTYTNGAIPTIISRVTAF